MAKARKRRNEINKVFVAIFVKLLDFLSGNIARSLINAIIFLELENVLNVKLKHISLCISYIVNKLLKSFKSRYSTSCDIEINTAVLKIGRIIDFTSVAIAVFLMKTHGRWVQIASRGAEDVFSVVR